VADASGDFLENAHSNLEERIPRTWLQTALLQTRGSMECLRGDVRQAMAGLSEPQLAQQLHAALERMVAALGRNEQFLEGRLARATDAFALGPFEKEALPSFYYISPPDPSWPREQQLAYLPGRTDLLAVSIHEVWPGHFLQHLHQEQVDSRILQSFSNSPFTEGWAHYTEEMMVWDAGFRRQDPAVQVGVLVTALLRNVRFLAAIGLHTQGMTAEEAERLFREKAFQDVGNARQQAVRGTFDPMYLSYTLGKLMIYKLREDWRARVGEAFSLKDFHDRFLSYGSAPIPTIRRAMLGEDAGPAL
jgi:hypothetical protein